MASIEIQGIDALIRKLDSMERVNDILEPPMQRAVLRLQRDMAEYPPQRPGSSYVRTGTLGRRWTTQVTRSGDGLTGKIGNNTVYAPFVQSARFQAAVHRGRWNNTDEATLERNRQRIVDDFDNAIQRALDE